MYNKTIKIVSIFLLIFWLVISAIWYYNPTSLLNVKYTTDLDLSELKEPHLIIASHYYNTVDAMIMCGESRKTKNTVNIVAEFNMSNRKDLYNQFWKSFPIYTSYRKINLYKGYKNNLVERSVKLLEKGEHVLMYLNDKNKSKGIYHILKSFNDNATSAGTREGTSDNATIPILFVKIYRKDQDLEKERLDNDFVKSFYGKEFNVEYEIVKDYPIKEEPEDFMKWVKERLYIKN